MRALLIGLILGAIGSIVSAVTGIQSFEADSRTGTVVGYWHGYERLYAVAYAIVFAMAAYAIHRRFAITWKLGFLALYFSAALLGRRGSSHRVHSVRRPLLEELVAEAAILFFRP
jgi:hypothetical protein